MASATVPETTLHRTAHLPSSAVDIEPLQSTGWTWTDGPGGTGMPPGSSCSLLLPHPLTAATYAEAPVSLLLQLLDRLIMGDEVSVEEVVSERELVSACGGDLRQPLGLRGRHMEELVG
eukprot:CAMPEP_0202903926 /NCGR_PEP_ID=MMETSP1392-20130828/27249_1 /ASSEMBLY_ACC=CAM_ASM_000868 /TAXON_ID=225041 /ORGANISM="Chlamydomonas chlamydogama, Strain SAG 11-48b" /LENGTH=118 /DNA_ID=CAMNT_0049591319 /DNA_START=487 /DNA_END=839 /DNA_ORIENTATION=-